MLNVAALCCVLVFLGSACDGVEANVDIKKGPEGKLVVDKGGKKIEAESINVKATNGAVKVEVKDKAGNTEVVVDSQK